MVEVALTEAVGADYGTLYPWGGPRRVTHGSFGTGTGEALTVGMGNLYVFSEPIEGQRLLESDLALQAFMRLSEKSFELHLGTS